ncbi:MAG: T9SS type A sorting domain-containing protein [Flavobacteriales bacterium]|nr:T9SS type A sorting domain-containing protein [Flavobacteriales bacterium]NQX98543.1 T9SS type A sorting domain-containing protein [Flavobacteriales bacterium]
MRQFLLIFLFASGTLFGQVNCPLNTPDFPIETTDGDYSWTANLYHPTQMGGAQNLTAISFRLDNDGSWGSYTYSNCKIWVRHTSVSSYPVSSSYPGTAGFTEVYSGNFTFNGQGVYTFNFNVAASFTYNGTSNLEVLFENRGGDDNSWEEPWFDRANASPAGTYIGKGASGFSWSNAKTKSVSFRFNLQINSVTCSVSSLPVTLSSSTLICKNDFVTVEWITETEINNSYFTIEKSNDGREWEEVISIDGAGNSSVTKKYSINIKKDKLTQENYYRLSQTDFDGTHKKLVTHSSNCNNDARINIYPNPFTEKITITTENINNVSIYNILGEKLNLSFSKKDNMVVLNTSTLVSGIYFIKVGDKSYKLYK